MFLHDSISSISIFAWLTSLKLDDLELEVDLTRAESAKYNFFDLEELYLDKIAPEAVHELFRISFIPTLISLDIAGCTGVDANIVDHWHYDSVVRTLTISPKTLIGGISVALVSWGGSTLIVRGISFDESAALLIEPSLPIPNPPDYRNCKRKRNICLSYHSKRRHTGSSCSSRPITISLSIHGTLYFSRHGTPYL